MKRASDSRRLYFCKEISKAATASIWPAKNFFWLRDFLFSGYFIISFREQLLLKRWLKFQSSTFWIFPLNWSKAHGHQETLHHYSAYMISKTYFALSWPVRSFHAGTNSKNTLWASKFFLRAKDNQKKT